jgi:hypothetical protein
VLELWEDTKGPEKGIKCFRGRWLFYPHHLPENHKERTRKRSGLELRQVYEQCDAAANDEENPLASVRSLQRVVCCWKDIRNREPSKEELQAAHAWFDSAWDNERSAVVPLAECVDKASSGACCCPAPRAACVLTPLAPAARFALIRSLEVVQPPTPAPALCDAGSGRTAAIVSASGAPEQPEGATAAVQKVLAVAVAAAKQLPSAAPLAEKPKAVKPSGAPAVAEKRTLAPAVAASAVPRTGLPATAVKQGEAALHGSKPSKPLLPPPFKSSAAVGDKRSRQEAVLTVEELPAKRAAVRAFANPQPAILLCFQRR